MNVVIHASRSILGKVLSDDRGEGSSKQVGPPERSSKDGPEEASPLTPTPTGIEFREKSPVLASQAGEGEYFPEASDIGSDSDLNEAKQSFKTNEAADRLEQINKKREEFIREALQLKSQSYTKPMNMLLPAMYVPKQIHDLL